MVELDRFKLYARVDYADDDPLILSMIAAADNAVRDMTGKLPPGETDELFDMAVLQLSAHWYENRTPVADGGVHEVPFTIQVLLSHIALSSRYPEKEDVDGAAQ